MTKKIIIGNWKMNPATVKEAVALALGIKRGIETSKSEVVLCPPYVFLLDVSKVLSKSGLKLGAQNCFCEDMGAFTGEISPAMLKSLGVGYVIIGHSERRNLFEDNLLINKKIKLLLKRGLKVIFCVGERERDEAGDYLRFVERELKEGLKNINKVDFKNLIIAYEPVWAIGKSSKGCCEAKDIREMSLFIKKVLAEVAGRQVGLKIPIVYGGSVDSKNAKDVIGSGVDGLLLGRACLDVTKCLEILKKISD
jgi:triosephosphate isomerase